MYVSASINGQVVRALLDTEATHNFIFEDEAKRLGLKMTKEGSIMKAINSSAKPIAGTTQGVHVTLGTWSRKLNFSIMSMNDFKMVLDMKFFDQVRVLPLPATNTLSIIDRSMAWMVPAEQNACLLEVEFLSYKIAGRKLMMKNSKVKVILEWEPLIKVPELRSFHGLVNYYCRFIKWYIQQKRHPWLTY